MKKGILIVISVLVLSNVAGAQKAPDSFLGIKWGITQEELRKIINSGDLYIYKNSISFSPILSEWRKIGEVKITNYLFKFSRSGFYEAVVTFPKSVFDYPDNFDILLKALTAKYGRPKMRTGLGQTQTHEWLMGNKVRVVLWHDNTKPKLENGSLVYTYLPIEQEAEKIRDESVEKTSRML